jgi:ribosomal protein S27E
MNDMSVFECENCGEHQTADKVLDTNAKCEKCGDAVVVYTVDAAKEMSELKERVEELVGWNKHLVALYDEWGFADAPCPKHSKTSLLKEDCAVCRAEAAEAKIKDLETQLAGCHSDAAVEAKLRRCKEALARSCTCDDWDIANGVDCTACKAIKELNSEE